MKKNITLVVLICCIVAIRGQVLEIICTELISGTAETNVNASLVDTVTGTTVAPQYMNGVLAFNLASSSLDHLFEVQVIDPNYIHILKSKVFTLTCSTSNCYHRVS
jgi:hypothetical protein